MASNELFDLKHFLVLYWLEKHLIYCLQMCLIFSCKTLVLNVTCKWCVKRNPQKWAQKMRTKDLFFHLNHGDLSWCLSLFITQRRITLLHVTGTTRTILYWLFIIRLACALKYIRVAWYFCFHADIILFAHFFLFVAGVCVTSMAGVTLQNLCSWGTEIEQWGKRCFRTKDNHNWGAFEKVLMQTFLMVHLKYYRKYIRESRKFPAFR